MRLDVYLFESGLCASRERARAMIMAGHVTVDGKRADKAGQEIKPAAQVELAVNDIPFVSRGGLKLEKAMTAFQLTLSDVVAVDVGASTGGFTDCMLQHGAKRVYAIDVGYGQLDWRIRNDPRVVVMERRNARYMQPDWFEQSLDFASIDVSFISLRLILPALLPCLAESGQVVALIKPQFEAGKNEVQRSGVIRSKSVHEAVLQSVLDFACTIGFTAVDLAFSPITGPKGNIEFLAHLHKSAMATGLAGNALHAHIVEIVDEAHAFLASPANKA